MYVKKNVAAFLHSSIRILNQSQDIFSGNTLKRFVCCDLRLFIQDIQLLLSVLRFLNNYMTFQCSFLGQFIRGVNLRYALMVIDALIQYESYILCNYFKLVEKKGETICKLPYLKKSVQIMNVEHEGFCSKILCAMFDVPLQILCINIFLNTFLTNWHY